MQRLDAGIERASHLVDQLLLLARQQDGAHPALRPLVPMEVLPRLRVPPRARLTAVILSSFAAHALEIALYAATVYALLHGFDAGTLGHAGTPAWTTVLHFSAQTYTSLGYGDMVPQGALRALSGVEALNGLLLAGFAVHRGWLDPVAVLAIASSAAFAGDQLAFWYGRRQGAAALLRRRRAQAASAAIVANSAATWSGRSGRDSR